jgi:hypothetical protein
MGDVASRPRLLVICTGLITTGGPDGDGLGLGLGEGPGVTPGVGVGITGEGLGLGGVYPAFRRNHS